MNVDPKDCPEPFGRPECTHRYCLTCSWTEPVEHVAPSGPTLRQTALRCCVVHNTQAGRYADHCPFQMPGDSCDVRPLLVADDSPDATHVLVRRDDLESLLVGYEYADIYYDRMRAALDRRAADTGQEAS